MPPLRSARFSRRFTGLLLCFLLNALLASNLWAAPAQPATQLPPHVHTFLQKYCYSCHDNTVATAKLSLESLPAQFRNAHWVRVHDKLAARQMPPVDESQPTAEERQQITAWLHQQLHAASRAHQQAEGRVLLRRLNRTEYEYTLHDLLGITVPLKNLLPEDNPVAGFDTVSTGLETSATHLVRYQEAADAALQAAVPGRPIQSERIRHTGREWLDSRPKPNQAGTRPFVRFEGDTIVLCATLYKHGSVLSPYTRIAGRYRIRAAVRAVNTAGKSIPVLIGKISPDRFAHEKLQHIIDIQDAPADKSRIIEVDLALPEGEQVYLEGLGLPFFQNLKKTLNDAPVPDDYAGPGLAVEWIELEGPIDPHYGYRTLFGDLPHISQRYVADFLAGKEVTDKLWSQWHPNEFSKPEHRLVPVSRDPKADAERLLRAFLPRAFRRPVTEDTTSYFVRFVHQQLDNGALFEEAMLAGYKAVLCSPHFLFFVERPGRLDDYAVAARLSHFLWSSLPDDELRSLAAKGELTRPDVLRSQTERMLRHPNARRFTEMFTGQWLDLRKFLDMKPDEIYSEYDDLLAWSMPRETTGFFDEILTRDLPTSTFLHSDWTYLNERLAQHYGIPGVQGLELRRVPLPADAHRGGVITHASVLKLTTNATYTSPVKRGAWVLDRILGKPPSPPPPDVKAVEPDIRGAVTIRQQLDKHKNSAVCASCHVHIDPPGFALENFDVVGGWREFYRVKQPPPEGKYVELANYPGRKVWLARPVEAQGQTEDGQPFESIDAYKQLLLKDPDQLTRNLAGKLLIYATGAEIQFADRAVIEQIVQDVRARNHGFRSLVHAIVQSDPFLMK